MSEKPKYPGMPRWVKALISAAVILLLVALVAMFAGGGHGPGRHFKSNPTPPPATSAAGPNDPALGSNRQ